jgi:D-3-phosphoglycerate dehydrogenase / 2-oxoglutarate reductase
MKPTAVLLNAARGPVIDEAALVDALLDGRIAGAALDVFENEPLPVDSPLRGIDNVMIAPHNSNSSPTAWKRVHLSTLDQLVAGLKG